MISRYGDNLKLSIWGASHEPQIGMELQGIPAGLSVDTEALQAFLNRRAPGRNEWSTTRKETDIPHFQSGLTDNYTNGKAITAVIYNENVRSKDYENLKFIPRPGHADYAAWMKYGLDFDMSGGGPFSGRMTAPLCIAGGMCKQWLENMGIRIGAHIASINGIDDNHFDLTNPQINQISTDFPVISKLSGEQMQAEIHEARKKGDSIGGIIQCAITGIPAGIGGPIFGGMESKIAQIIYSIPAVKSLEFGLGFASAHRHGSENNDEYSIIDGKIRTKTNFCGGILGGITNGMPVIFQVAIKPTPSISKPQKSVNLKTMKAVTIKTNGRHDPCIVPRAVPVVEAAAAIAVYDMILGEQTNTKRN